MSREALEREIASLFKEMDEQNRRAVSASENLTESCWMHAPGFYDGYADEAREARAKAQAIQSQIIEKREQLRRMT